MGQFDRNIEDIKEIERLKLTVKTHEDNIKDLKVMLKHYTDNPAINSQVSTLESDIKILRFSIKKVEAEYDRLNLEE